MLRWYNLAINSGSIFMCYQYLICWVGSAITFRANENEELHCIVFCNPLANVRTLFWLQAYLQFRTHERPMLFLLGVRKSLRRSALQRSKMLEEFWIEVWAWKSFLIETRWLKKHNLDNTTKTNLRRPTSGCQFSITKSALLTQIYGLWIESHKTIFRNYCKVKHPTWSVPRLLEVKTTSGKEFLVCSNFCFGTPVRHGVILLEQLCDFLQNLFFNFSNDVTWHRVGVLE